MHQLAKKGLLVVIGTTGALASAAVGMANASSGAQGTAAGSPGVASGNNIQVPIHIPVNVCGNTVNVIGALNPAFGNHCANGTVKQPPTHPPTTKPPCVPCTQPPTTKPPTTGPPTLPPPPPPTTGPPTLPPPPPTTQRPGTTGGTTGGSTPPRNGGPSLAQTGSSALTVAPIGVALLLGGFVLYRRSRPTTDG